MTGRKDHWRIRDCTFRHISLLFWGGGVLFVLRSCSCSFCRFLLHYGWFKNCIFLKIVTHCDKLCVCVFVSCQSSAWSALAWWCFSSASCSPYSGPSTMDTPTGNYSNCTVPERTCLHEFHPAYLTVVHDDCNDLRASLNGSLHNIAAQLFQESAAGLAFVTFTDQ